MTTATTTANTNDKLLDDEQQDCVKIRRNIQIVDEVALFNEWTKPIKLPEKYIDCYYKYVSSKPNSMILMETCAQNRDIDDQNFLAFLVAFELLGECFGHYSNKKHRQAGIYFVAPSERKCMKFLQKLHTTCSLIKSCGNLDAVTLDAGRRSLQLSVEIENGSGKFVRCLKARDASESIPFGAAGTTIVCAEAVFYHNTAKVIARRSLESAHSVGNINFILLTGGVMDISEIRNYCNANNNE